MSDIRCLIIGSSTGGQNALIEILPLLNGSLNIPIIIVQHNLKGMSDMMAVSLKRVTLVPFREAQGGELLEYGETIFYLAKAGYHTRIIWNRDHIPILVVREDKNNPNLLPQIDETMTTGTEVFGSALLGVVLTGMGNDGTKGLEALKKAGGTTLVQDPKTCAVPSMPESAISARVVDYIVPLPEIAGRINHLVLSKRRK
jgi:two-component system chemotaxis response regulator CheB